MKDTKEMWAATRELTVRKVNVLYNIEDNKVTHYAFESNETYYDANDHYVKAGSINPF